MPRPRRRTSARTPASSDFGETSASSVEPPRVRAGDIDALVGFLPIFERPGFSFGRWSGGKVDGQVDDGDAMSAPHFEPSRDALRFLTALRDRGWIEEFDWPAWQGRAARYARTPAALGRARLGTLRKLLTLHARKERFCEGHLAAMFESGHLAAILRRLGAIRARMK